MTSILILKSVIISCKTKIKKQVGMEGSVRSKEKLVYINLSANIDSLYIFYYRYQYWLK